MNKKELLNLKKNFKEDGGYFVFNKILTAFIDGDKNLVGKEIRSFGTLDPDDQELIVDVLKKGISGSLGKNLTEYAFPNETYEEGGAQNILYKTYKDKLENEESVMSFIENVIGKINYLSPFTLFTVHCTYTLFKKNSNDEKTDVTTDYNFLLTAICPVSYGESSLVVDGDDNRICKRRNVDRIVGKVPSDAFLFPILSDGELDINSVLYYSAKPNEPNKSIIEDVLGCTFTMTAEAEKSAFSQVLVDAIGEDLDYSLVTRLNEKIESVIDEKSADDEPATIDNSKLCEILTDLGVDDEAVEEVKGMYDELFGGKEITATNIVKNKTVINTPDVTVTISRKGTDKVRTSVMNGHKCLVIDLDDPNIVVNGLPMTL